MNANIYEKNNKTFVFHQYQRNTKNKQLTLKSINIGHEIKMFEFYKIDDIKIDEAMEKNLEEIKQYNYIKDFPIFILE